MFRFLPLLFIAATMLLAGCAGTYLPLTAESGTSITRLSKITGSVGPAPVGGAHGETCQFVQVNPVTGTCVHMKQDNCEINTCGNAPSGE